MATPIWKGNKELTETPTSPEWTFDGEGDVCVRTYEGPYDKCLAKRPKRGAKMPDIDKDLRVEKVTIQKRPGGKGVMSVTLAYRNPNPDNADDATFDPTEEVEWVQIQKELRTAPIYSTGGAKTLTPKDVAGADLWLGQGGKADFTYTDGQGATQTLSANAQHYAAKLAKGETSYIVFAPVARLTYQSRTKPTTTACGKRGAAPISSAPSGYDYLSTADRAIRNGRFGKWTRTLEATGADAWDPDLYPT
jgi:hypothetical protein